MGSEEMGIGSWRDTISTAKRTAPDSPGYAFIGAVIAYSRVREIRNLLTRGRKHPEEQQLPVDFHPRPLDSG
jgi:hypothetical protein